MANPEAANPRHEDQRALREWVSHAEGARAQLQAIRSELERARPKTQSIREAVHAELTARVRGVLEAAKKEGERVLLAAQQQAQASLAAAREEAGETIAAARREASASVAAARPEAVQANEMAMRFRMEAERFIKRLEDTIGGPLSDEANPSAPALSEASAHPWEPHPDADAAAVGAGVSPGFEPYEPPTPAPSHHANDDETTDPHGLESIDRRLIDRLWAEP
jgi:F0F1-type ATP synthase membrane subunit b/b'